MRGELNMYSKGRCAFRNSADLPGVIERLKTYRAGAEQARRLEHREAVPRRHNETGNSAVLSPMCGHAPPTTATSGWRPMSSPGASCCATPRASTYTSTSWAIARSGRPAMRWKLRARNSRDTERLENSVTLAHCGLVDPADMHRPAELGIIVNWAAHWSGAYLGETAKRHLGDERWESHVSVQRHRGKRCRACVLQRRGDGLSAAREQSVVRHAGGRDPGRSRVPALPRCVSG